MIQIGKNPIKLAEGSEFELTVPIRNFETTALSDGFRKLLDERLGRPFLKPTNNGSS